MLTVEILFRKFDNDCFRSDIPESFLLNVLLDVDLCMFYVLYRKRSNSGFIVLFVTILDVNKNTNLRNLPTTRVLSWIKVLFNAIVNDICCSG